jgi:hypothetical protein
MVPTYVRLYRLYKEHIIIIYSNVMYVRHHLSKVEDRRQQDRGQRGVHT